MIPVHVEFREGWTSQRALVVIDGRTLVDRRPVTRMQIGLAESIGLELNAGAHRIEVRVGDDPDGDDPTSAAAAVATEIGAELSTESWISIDLGRDGVPVVAVADRPTGYL